MMARIINQQLDVFEISKSICLVQESYPNEIGWIFNSITLLEHFDKEMHQYNNDETILASNSSIPRKSFLILVEKSTGNVYEVVVNLSEDKVERFDDVSTKCKSEVCFGNVELNTDIDVLIHAGIKDNPDEESKSSNEIIQDNSRALRNDLNALPESLTFTKENTEIQSQFRLR